MFGRRSSAKMIKFDIQPIVCLSVQLEIFVTDFLGSDIFLSCLDFSGCSVLVGSTDVQNLIVDAPAISCIDIGWQNATDDVTKVRNVVNIGQSRRNENFPGLLFGLCLEEKAGIIFNSLANESTDQHKHYHCLSLIKWSYFFWNVSFSSSKAWLAKISTHLFIDRMNNLLSQLESNTN